MSVKTAIAKLKENMQQEDIRPETGLGDDLFLFSSTLAPVVNVDILAINENREFILSWRVDPHCGTGGISPVAVPGLWRHWKKGYKRLREPNLDQK